MNSCSFKKCIFKKIFSNQFYKSKHIKSKVVNATVLVPSDKDCVRFEYESFAALHQMFGGLTDYEKAEAWNEIEIELSKFENRNGFAGPCELIVGVGQKPMN